jgi:hypothetical protein
MQVKQFPLPSQLLQGALHSTHEPLEEGWYVPKHEIQTLVALQAKQLATLHCTQAVLVGLKLNPAAHLPQIPL